MLRNSASLTPGSKRSRLEWTSIFGDTECLSLIAAGVLTLVGGKSLDGFVGIFDFGHGVQDYQIEFAAGSYNAFPVSGGDMLKNVEAIVFSAHPSALLAKIFGTNKFDHNPTFGSQSEMVAAGIRETKSGTKFGMIVVLDKEWFQVFGAEAFFKASTKGVSSLVVVSDVQTVPWSLERQVLQKCMSSISGANNYQIPIDSYCHPSLRLGSDDVAECYPDVIIFDAVSKKMFAYGKEIKMKPGSRPYNYLRGVMLMGSSKMSVENFRSEYLEDHSQEANVTVNQAKHQLKERLEKVDLPKTKIESLMNLLIAPSKEDNLVVHNLKREDFVVWGDA